MDRSTLGRVLLLLSAGSAVARAEPAPAPREGDETNPEGWLEVTAGTALGYPAGKVFRYRDDTELLPATSALFMAEYAVARWFRVGASYDLMTTTERVVVGGVVNDTVLPSRVALGATISPLFVDFSKNARIEGLGSGFFGLTLEGPPRAVPIVMGRLHVMPNRHRGVGIYLGFSYHLVIEKLTLLYGVGYRF